MGIITKGLGTGGLITQGYGVWEVIKKIIEWVSRVIPIKRIPFEFRIPVIGDKVIPFKEEIRVSGKKDFFELLWLLLEDEDEGD